LSRAVVVTLLALAACGRRPGLFSGGDASVTTSPDARVSTDGGLDVVLSLAPDGATVGWLDALPPAPRACLDLGFDPSAPISELALPGGACAQPGISCGVATRDKCREYPGGVGPEQLWQCACDHGAWACKHIGGARTACPPSTDASFGFPVDASAIPTDGAGVVTVPTDGGAPDVFAGPCRRNAFPTDAGTCQCQEATPTVCPAACVDLETDPGNCGACGNSCAPTATCQAGKCGVEPESVVVFVDPEACKSLDIAFDDGVLYWASRGTGVVDSDNLETGARVTISTGEDQPRRLLVRGQNVLWVAGAQGDTIRWKRPAFGVGDAVRAPGDLGGYDVSPDGATIFLQFHNDVASVPGGGGALTSWARSANPNSVPLAFRLDGDKLLVHDNQGFLSLVTMVTGTVARCDDVDAAGVNHSVNCTRVATGVISDQRKLQMFFMGGHAVWADDFDVQWAPLTGATKEVIATLDAPVTGLAVTADAAYVASDWVGSPTLRGTIYRVPLQAHQKPTALARLQAHPRSLAVGAGRVFWSTSDCVIMSAKL
jgi:hypothetical protein